MRGPKGAPFVRRQFTPHHLARRRREIASRTAYPHAKPNDSTMTSRISSATTHSCKLSRTPSTPVNSLRLRARPSGCATIDRRASSERSGLSLLKQDRGLTLWAVRKWSAHHVFRRHPNCADCDAEAPRRKAGYGVPGVPALDSFQDRRGTKTVLVSG
jgi:hypothetical protein